MYTTFLQVLYDVRENFQKVDQLGYSIISDQPIYNHDSSKSGIGCAIGCLLSSTDSDDLQKRCKEYGRYGVDLLIENDNFSDLFSEFKLSGDLAVGQLTILQRVHDNSNCHRDFMKGLNNLITVVENPVFNERPFLFETLFLFNIQILTSTGNIWDIMEDAADDSYLKTLINKGRNYETN